MKKTPAVVAFFWLIMISVDPFVFIPAVVTKPLLRRRVNKRHIELSARVAFTEDAHYTTPARSRRSRRNASDSVVFIFLIFFTRRFSSSVKGMTSRTRISSFICAIGPITLTTVNGTPVGIRQQITHSLALPFSTLGSFLKIQFFMLQLKNAGWFGEVTSMVIRPPLVWRK